MLCFNVINTNKIAILEYFIGSGFIG